MPDYSDHSHSSASTPTFGTDLRHSGNNHGNIVTSLKATIEFFENSHSLSLATV